MRIRRGDQVIIITGEDAGLTPRRVIQVIDGGRKLVVEGANQVFKHVRRGHPKSPSGGRLNLEMPIDSSNVMLYCNSCTPPRGVRVGFHYTDDGSKERICRKCGASLGNVSPPKSRHAKK